LAPDVATTGQTRSAAPLPRTWPAMSQVPMKNQLLTQHAFFLLLARRGHLGETLIIVMAGLVPAIRVLHHGKKFVDARDEALAWRRVAP